MPLHPGRMPRPLNPPPPRRSRGGGIPLRGGLLALAIGFGASALFFSPDACADGGVVLGSQQIDGVDVTVFGSPVPLRAGPADISVLIQDENRRVVSDANVTVNWVSGQEGEEWLPPCCSMKGGSGVVRALKGHSQNQMLYSAIIPITSSGKGLLRLSIESAQARGTIELPIDAAPAPPPALAYFPYIAIGPGLIGLFALRRYILRARQH